MSSVEKLNLVALRKSTRCRRQNLSTQDNERLSDEAFSRFEYSYAACLHAKDIPEFPSVAIYHSLPEELSMKKIEIWTRGVAAKIFYPRVKDLKNGLVDMVEVLDSKKEKWKKGCFGILEPTGKTVIEPVNLDLIFVPGVLFGGSGERIGMGAGFYDRYLAKAKKALRVSLAFDFQFQYSLPQNKWDQRVDWIVTDRRECQVGRVRK